MTSYVATSSADILLTFRRRPWRFILGGVLVFLVGIGLWLLLNQLLKPAPPPVVPPIPVLAAVAQTGEVPVYLTGLGTVQAYNAVAVHVQVDATLSKVLFVEGQTVTAGELFGQIDPRPLWAQLDESASIRCLILVFGMNS